MACFLAGLITNSVHAGGALRRLEERLLNRFPVYKFFRRLSSIAGGNEENSGTPVVVRQDDGKLIGFLVEQHNDGDCTVFFPESPTVMTGAVKIVRADRVERLKARRSEVARILGSFG